MKNNEIVCNYLIMTIKPTPLTHASRPLLDSVLELKNNRMRDRGVSKYFLFPAANSIIVRAQIAYDLPDNRKELRN